MNIRFTNVKILTMEPGREIFDGELHVKDDWIVYVGPTCRKPWFPCGIARLTEKEIC